MSRFDALFGPGRVLVGVVHLPPLPGYPASPGLDAVLATAVADAAALAAGGARGVLVENEHDRPHRVEAARETIAVMTRVAREVVLAVPRVAVGVEILLHDPMASLAVAAASGARFVRTDYFVDPMEREGYGPMPIDPDGWLDYRRRIGADDVLVLADIQVKYARLLAPRSLAASAREARLRGADAIVVTGLATGDAPAPEAVAEAKEGAGPCPVLVGSGLDARNARTLLSVADGAIVGTALQREGRIERGLVEELARIAAELDAGASP